MTAFATAVERHLEGIDYFGTGACPGCSECGLDHISQPDDDPQAYEAASAGDEFSWDSCESCGSHLAGSRHPAHGVIREASGDTTLVHLSICTDCLLFHANGEEPEDWR